MDYKPEKVCDMSEMNLEIILREEKISMNERGIVPVLRITNTKKKNVLLQVSPLEGGITTTVRYNNLVRTFTLSGISTPIENTMGDFKSPYFVGEDLTAVIELDPNETVYADLCDYNGGLEEVKFMLNDKTDHDVWIVEKYVRDPGMFISCAILDEELRLEGDSLASEIESVTSVDNIDSLAVLERL